VPLPNELVNAFRMLRRSPGYALTCIAVLALGIGANAAIAILAISPVALYVPLRRATAVDCTVALREE
jgi:hypothetical protein